LPKSVVASGGDIIEDVAILQTQRGDDGQNALNETATIVAVGPKAPLSPKDGVTDGSFGSVVGGLDAVDENKGPQRGPHLKNAAALLGDALHGRPLRETSLDLRLDRSHEL
jgi:hypothetical protein